MGYEKYASRRNDGKLPTPLRSQLPAGVRSQLLTLAGRFGQRFDAIDGCSPGESPLVNQFQQPAFPQSGQSVCHGPAACSNSSPDVCRACSHRSVLRVPPQNEPRQSFRPRQSRHRTINERIQFAEAVGRSHCSLRPLVPLAGRCWSRSRRFHRRQDRATRQHGRASVDSVVRHAVPHSSAASSGAASVRPHSSAIAACSLPRGSRFVVDVSSPQPVGVND